jgi:hypothetical protein
VSPNLIKLNGISPGIGVFVWKFEAGSGTSSVDGLIPCDCYFSVDIGDLDSGDEIQVLVYHRVMVHPVTSRVMEAILFSFY